ncbi:MmgE/PrpD family protein [Microbaculum marinum]|uniref:MmgE/PrpD family protein n=1 Tax=Microbaculum marinum TaxID=1764581 RepID=A0AAW9RQI5_9HYPH
MTVTRELAEYLVESRSADLPDDVRREARRALVNIVGCALGGAPEEATEIAIRTFTPFSGPKDGLIVGRREKLDPLRAALVNGISTHVHDYDDTLPKNYIHASSPVASALLAYASCNDVSGEDFLHAFVLGFETTSRVGNATYPSHYDVGWHSTGTCGVLGAAAAIGKLTGLGVQDMVWTIGLAATQSAGIREMFGSMGKPFHPGRAAQNGYEAALLARNGFTSGEYGLEGPRGFAHVLAADRDLAKVTDGLGRDFDLRVNTYKPFPCGIVNHPAIDACIQLKEEHRLDAAAIRAVRLRVAPLVMDLCGKRDISTGLQGKFSVVHGAAVGLVRGRAGLDEYTDAAVNDPEVKRVRDAAVPEGDPAITEDGVHVEVELADGSVLAKTLEHSLGNLERPMSDDQLSAKFRDQAVRALPAEQVETVLQACWTIDALPAVGDLVAGTVPR